MVATDVSGVALEGPAGKLPDELSRLVVCMRALWCEKRARKRGAPGSQQIAARQAHCPGLPHAQPGRRQQAALGKPALQLLGLTGGYFGQFEAAPMGPSAAEPHLAHVYSKLVRDYTPAFVE